MMNRVLVIVAFVAAVSVTPQAQSQETARVYCGRHLADTIAALCRNFGYKKRAMNSRAPWWQTEKIGGYLPWLGGENSEDRWKGDNGVNRVIIDMWNKDDGLNAGRGENNGLGLWKGDKNGRNSWKGEKNGHGVESWWSLMGTRGKRTGLATECCEKACTTEEMLSYC